MVKRICALFLALLLLTAGSSLADLKLDESTPALKSLKTYMENVNTFLAESGEQEINHIFDQLKTIVELGITSSEDAYEPEGVTVSVYLYYGSINYLLLRVNDANRFPKVAAAFRRALNPQTMTQEEALKTPAERAKKAVKNPTDSFVDKVEDEKLNGISFREFYAYYPDQYHDGVNWSQLLIIFPQEGFWNEETGIIDNEAQPKTEDRESDQAEEYDGYYSTDGYEHLSISMTPTPEPDSAAAEYDEFFR
ncbi:MAG: hypothetical protein IKE15_06405 [Clostridia bacterium]|nr:hypothetical protein [Clostridia bacterium]